MLRQLTPLDFEHDVVAVLDRSGYVRFISRADPSSLDAQPPGGVVGRHLSELVHPEDVHQFDNWLNVEFLGRSGATASHIMFRSLRRDGTWRWLEATRPNPEGHHVRDHMILFLRDIAAHRLVEHQYRMAEQAAGFGIWSIRKNSSYAYLSRGMVHLFGFDRGDPETKKKFWPLSRVERQDARKVLKILRRAMEAPKEFSFVCAVNTKDGSRRVLETNGHVECDVVGMDTIFAISQDITAIHMAETRLRASEEKYRLLTQSASDIICQLSPDGAIEFISPSVRRLTGRRPSRLVGLKFHTLLPESEHAPFDEFLTRLRKGDEDARCAVRFTRACQDEAWLEISGRTLKDDAGKVFGVVCTARDISERKEFELELRRAREDADAASASKSKFLATVSHELRTPLNAILGYSELIRGQRFSAPGEDRAADYAARIHESGAILSSLINDLLDLAKIEAGNYDLKPQHIALGEVVQFCVHQIGPQVAAKTVEIEDSASETDVGVFADRRALKQILLNLLSNAAKFTREGGRIKLSVREEDGVVALAVCDTGIGIRREDIERVTVPFEQLTDNRKGTGLGLSIVKSLTELHGGNLTVESEPGKGTCVTVRLPQEQARDESSLSTQRRL